MQRNRMMWLVVFIFVSTAVAATLDARGDLGRKIGPAPEPKGTPPNISKYGTADYNAEEPLDSREREKRKIKSKRYDNQDWVHKKPHPETGMVGRHTEAEPPQALPTGESEIIIIGKVVGLQTHLSNDKSGVYTEYKIKVDQVLKNGLSNDLPQGGSLTIDRAGGVVRYPHGQVVVYWDSDKGLPENGREYLFFLRSEGGSENYTVITLYELQASKTVALDRGRAVDHIERMGKSDLVDTVKDKMNRTKDE